MDANRLLESQPTRVVPRRGLLWLAAFLVCSLSTGIVNSVAQEHLEDFEADAFADLHVQVGDSETDVSDPASAKFDDWESLVEEDCPHGCEQPHRLPFDCVRHYGFRHSSTQGRHVGLSIPLEGTSWLS